MVALSGIFLYILLALAGKILASNLNYFILFEFELRFSACLWRG